MPPPWKERCAERKQKQLDSIPRDWLAQIPPVQAGTTNVIDFPSSCPLLSPTDLEITDTVDVDELLARLARAEWTAVQVTTAFYKRAIIAHRLTNCLTEIFIERALERAAFLDRHLKASGKVIGPLHGG